MSMSPLAETPLTTVLRDVITDAGPITFERFMQIVLHHPEHGYYRQGNPLGVEGDFVTSPEISQIFGEMVGVWLINAWHRMGKPAEFALLELGPGRGLMLQQALQFTQTFPDFHRAMKLHLFESNATLRVIQTEKLRPYNPVYLERISDCPPLPTILLANEFFDTMPLRQFVRGFFGWREQFVTFKDNKLQLKKGSLRSLPKNLVHGGYARHLKRGCHYEVSPIAQTYMQQLSAQISSYGGAGLIIDYGYELPPREGTLAALHRHEFVDIFAVPGKADVTAGVDFSVLADIARNHRLSAANLINQKTFLQKMGIDHRVNILNSQISDEQREQLKNNLYQITSETKLGKCKVLEIFKEIRGA